MKESILADSDNSTHLARYDNSWYRPGPRWKIALWFVVNAVFFANRFAVFGSIKCILLRSFGGLVGKGVVIKPSVSIKYPWLLTVGDDVWIGENVWIDNLAMVTIGSNVCISQGAYLLTGNHHFGKQTFDLMIDKIVLESGVWIGAKATVCPGVVCRSHSVLAVGSVATKELEAYSIYQGVPAIKIQQRTIE